MFAPFSLKFYLNYKVSIEIQGLSSTDCNFQGLSRPWIFILKFKDIQGLLRCVRTLWLVPSPSQVLNHRRCGRARTEYYDWKRTSTGCIRFPHRYLPSVPCQLRERNKRLTICNFFTDRARHVTIVSPSLMSCPFSCTTDVFPAHSTGT